MKPIDGKTLARTIRDEIKQTVAALPSPPGLGVLLVGSDPASHTYVSLKEKAAHEAGIHTIVHRLPADTSDDTLEQVIHRWNADHSIHGILLQVPLPPGHDTDRLIRAIDPTKDVDGFHPATTTISPVHEAVLRLIAATGFDPREKSATILANSETFSLPLIRLLQRAGFITATMHPDLLDGDILRTSDVIIVAVGRPGIIGPDLVKPGAIIVDIGTTKDATGHIHGDADAHALAATEGWITPVPGGVGPMTIALLFQNLIRLYNDSRRRS